MKLTDFFESTYGIDFLDRYQEEDLDRRAGDVERVHDVENESPPPNGLRAHSGAEHCRRRGAERGPGRGSATLQALGEPVT